MSDTAVIVETSLFDPRIVLNPKAVKKSLAEYDSLKILFRNVDVEEGTGVIIDLDDHSERHTFTSWQQFLNIIVKRKGRGQVAIERLEPDLFFHYSDTTVTKKENLTTGEVIRLDIFEPLSPAEQELEFKKLCDALVQIREFDTD